MELWQNFLPTQVVFGSGCLDGLRGWLEAPPGSRLLLVTSAGSMRRLGYVDRVLRQLEGFTVQVWDQITPNPDIPQVEAAVAWARRCQAQVIIALGGGSVIDTAKAAVLLQNSSRSLREALTQPADSGDSVPYFLAIPTTSGTGSEVTPFATIWDMTARKKFSLQSPCLFPRLALVDPSLTLELPPGITASTGMDAFCHALEAYWSPSAQPVTDLLALRAMEIIVNSLPAACAQPAERWARENMALASLLAGMAFSQTQTGAAHALSYPLTVWFGTPHGIACSISLPHLLLENAPALGEKTARIARALSQGSIQAASRFLEIFMERLGLPTRLRELGVSTEHLDLLVREALASPRIANNPQPLSPPRLRRLLERTL